MVTVTPDAMLIQHLTGGGGGGQRDISADSARAYLGKFFSDLIASVEDKSSPFLKVDFGENWEKLYS